MFKFSFRDKSIVVETKKNKIEIKEEALILSIIIAFIIPYYFQIIELSKRSKQLPLFIVFIISLLILMRLIKCININKETDKSIVKSKNSQATKEEGSFINKFPLLPILGLLFLAFGVSIVGTYISVPVFVFLMMFYYGLRKWVIMILLSLGVTLFLYFVFKIWLMVPLPQGIIFG